jgi:hypothetical protein
LAKNKKNKKIKKNKNAKNDDKKENDDKNEPQKEQTGVQSGTPSGIQTNNHF